MSKAFLKILVFLYLAYIDVHGAETNNILTNLKEAANDSPRREHHNKFVSRYTKIAFNEKNVRDVKNKEKVRRPKVKLKSRNKSKYNCSYAMLHEEEDNVNELGVINPYAEHPQLNPYDIKNHLIHIFSQFDEANVTAEVIGQTVEYKDIVLIKVTDKKEDTDLFWRTGNDKYETDTKEKKIIFIVHGLGTAHIHDVPCLHRVTDFKELVSFYLAHLQDFDIFIIPLANPDGYAKNAEDYWNKNVSPQQECDGVALDRNFDVAWSNHTISSCSPFYPGPRPFSEAESKAIKDVLHRYSTKITAYINVHAVNNDFEFQGDTVLYPKGYTDVQSDEDKYLDLKGEIDEAMSNASFRVISVNVDSLHNWYGKVSGTSVDYASKVYGIPFAMEFIMQSYKTEFDHADYVETHNHAAMVQIWKRVIDTVFKFIRKTNNPTEAD